MSYTHRHRHKTRREKLNRTNKTLRLATIFVVLFLIVLGYMYRVSLWDWFRYLFK